MKTVTVLLSLGLLAGCSSPTDEQNTTGTSATNPTTPASRDAEPAPSASTTGIVNAVDPAAKTITIAHQPVGG